MQSTKKIKKNFAKDLLVWYRKRFFCGFLWSKNKHYNVIICLGVKGVQIIFFFGLFLFVLEIRTHTSTNGALCVRAFIRLW